MQILHTLTGACIYLLEEQLWLSYSGHVVVGLLLHPVHQEGYCLYNQDVKITSPITRVLAASTVNEGLSLLM